MILPLYARMRENFTRDGSRNGVEASASGGGEARRPHPRAEVFDPKSRRRWITGRRVREGARREPSRLYVCPASEHRQLNAQPSRRVARRCSAPAGTPRRRASAGAQASYRRHSARHRCWSPRRRAAPRSPQRQFAAEADALLRSSEATALVLSRHRPDPLRGRHP